MKYKVQLIELDVRFPGIGCVLTFSDRVVQTRCRLDRWRGLSRDKLEVERSDGARSAGFPPPRNRLRPRMVHKRTSVN